MSKQDIEKRLGFAAQGVKETTRTSAKAKFDREVGRKGNKSAMITKNGPDADASWLAYVVQHHGEGQGESVLGTMRSYSTEARAKAAALRGLETSGLRGGFARPGVKAKFAKPQFRTKKLHNGYIAVEVNQGNGWERYDTTHEESWNGIEEYERGYQKAYDRGLRYSGGSWRIPSTNASRPGVKAKMGLEMNMLDFRHKFFTAFGTAIRDAKSNPNTAEAQSDETVLRESWASMFAQGYSDAISDLNGLSATMKSKTSVGQMRKAASDAMEAYRQAKAAVRSSRLGAKAKMAAEIASDPRDKDFEKLKTLKGVVHQGKGFYIIPNKLMTPERRTKVKRSTQRYELSSMGDLVGWGTNHPNVNDYRLKDWAEAFA
jgi:hypothetical protein